MERVVPDQPVVGTYTVQKCLENVPRIMCYLVDYGGGVKD